MGMAGIQCNNSSFQSLELVQPGLSRGGCSPVPPCAGMSLCNRGSGAHFFTSVLTSHLLSAVVQSEHNGSPKRQGCLPLCPSLCSSQGRHQAPSLAQVLLPLLVYPLAPPEISPQTHRTPPFLPSAWELWRPPRPSPAPHLPFPPPHTSAQLAGTPRG